MLSFWQRQLLAVGIRPAAGSRLLFISITFSAAFRGGVSCCQPSQRGLGKLCRLCQGLC